jgi:hypothetical protein
MTTETIKDVLGRILTINKNLTEESLRNLLVASSWDIQDINEGLRIFRDFSNGNRNTNEAVKPTVDLYSGDEKKTQSAENNVVELKKNEVLDIGGPEKSSSSNLAEEALAEIRDKEQAKKPAPTPVIESTSNPKIVEEQTKAIGMDKDIFLEESKEIVEENKTEAVTPEKEIAELTVEEEVKPWGLIFINSILFLIALSLLIYILFVS